MSELLRNSLVFFLLIFFLAGCGGSVRQSPVSPGLISDIAVTNYSETDTGRSILASGSLQFDFQTLTCDFVPLRNAEKHWDVNPILNPPNCTDCVKINVVEYVPAEKRVKVSIALKNPTVLTGYDVRGIAMTNDPGVRMTNADAYTALWDDGGDVTTNPFRAYWTDETDRSFEGHGNDIHYYTFTYEQLSGLFETVLVVDASWQGHAEEPYDIVDQTYSGELTTSPWSSIIVTCSVLDWQGDVSAVSLDLSELGGTEPVEMHANGAIFSAEVNGLETASPGIHRIWIMAGDSVAEEKIYDTLTVEVGIGAPGGFALKPGETFVEASWFDGFDGIEEWHLYKREHGQEYDFGSPIVVSGSQTTYMDNDVLAGHMYYYELAAVYSGSETELTSEHGARPFLWGEIVAVSYIGGASFYPEVIRGLDDSLWATWDPGYAEDLENPYAPDWCVYYYALMPGAILKPQVFVDQDGYVYLCGADTADLYKIRWIKCHPYDITDVLIDKHVFDDVMVEGVETQASMDSNGLLHVVFLRRPETDAAYQAYYATIDQDGNTSEPEMISSGWVDGEFVYGSKRPGIFASSNGKVHVVWRATTSTGRWVYRVLSDGEWGEEETIVDPIPIGSHIDMTLWETPDGVVYFCDTGSFMYYRGEDGWHGPILTEQHMADMPGDGGGEVTGDEYGNAMFVWTRGWADEVKYRQLNNSDWSDEFPLTVGHNYTGYENSFGRITTDKDGLAVVVWQDQYPYGSNEIFVRRQIME